MPKMIFGGFIIISLKPEPVGFGFGDLKVSALHRVPPSLYVAEGFSLPESRNLQGSRNGGLKAAATLGGAASPCSRNLQVSISPCKKMLPFASVAPV